MTLAERVPVALRAAWARHAAELVIVLVAAAVTAAVVHAVIAAANFHATSPVAPALGPVWAAAMIAIAAVAHIVQLRAGTARAHLVVAVLAGVAVGIAMAPLTAGLHGTNQPPNTIAGGDMAFHTEYVTRFGATWHLQDYTFRGLHAFYPPAWFWAAGRTADLLGVTPWHIVKPFTILTIGAALLLAYGLWRMVLTPAGALSAAIGSSLVLTYQAGPAAFATLGWYSTHSCFVAVTGAAWVAATLFTVRRGAFTGRLVFLALVGAVLALSYYLLFIVLVIVLAALALAPRVDRRAALRRVGALLGGIALLTAVFWVPLLGALLNGAASQGHYLRSDFLHVSVGIGGPVALSVLAIVAIATLALTFSSPASQAVAGVIAGTILYQLASVTTLLFAHNQLQPHRAVTMMWATFGAAVPVAFEAIRRSGASFQLPAPVLRAIGAAALAPAIGATFVLGAAQGSDLAAGPYSRAAHQRQLHLGQTAAISRFITQTSGKQPQQLTLLTGDVPLLVTEPYYGFLALRSPRYAHPEAHLPERIAVLRAAAACPDAACTTQKLTSSRFGPIDAMVLARTPAGLRVETAEDAFPTPRPVTVTFKRKSLDPATWTSRDFGPYAVFVRRTSR